MDQILLYIDFFKFYANIHIEMTTSGLFYKHPLVVISGDLYRKESSHD